MINTSVGNADNLQSRQILRIIGKSLLNRNLFVNYWTECQEGKTDEHECS